MSSSTTREPPAISLDRVSKSYRLFGSQREQLLEVLGFNQLFGQSKAKFKEFTALSDVSFEIPKGHRVGVVGRNGAGKTTLLKLICGNFAPSRGEIRVHGSVQSLMGSGIGFHPDYTGRENVLASLQYNGLGRQAYEAALEDVIDFCELGEFIDQPFKTYSLGMQARLMFATSTAIRPDILIVDEVLGAGDGYFIAKSRQRMERLVGGGCTMLLVSHSTQQILEMCQDAIWLDKGSIRMQGSAFEVVKAYEEFIHNTNKVLRQAPASAPAAPSAAKPPTSLTRETGSDGIPLQEPAFLPHAARKFFSTQAAQEIGFDNLAPGGLSRWNSEPGVKVQGLAFVGPNGPSSVLRAFEPLEVVVVLRLEIPGPFRCRYGFVVNDIHGRILSKIFSPLDAFDGEVDSLRTVRMLLDPLQLGSGEYTVGVAVWEYGPLEVINSARRYDLLSRTFSIKVEVPDSLVATDCLFYHTAEWRFADAGCEEIPALQTHTGDANGSN